MAQGDFMKSSTGVQLLRKETSLPDRVTPKHCQGESSACLRLVMPQIHKKLCWVLRNKEKSWGCRQKGFASPLLQLLLTSWDAPVLVTQSRGVTTSRDRHTGFPVDFLLWVEVAAEHLLLDYQDNPLMSSESLGSVDHHAIRMTLNELI